MHCLLCSFVSSFVINVLDTLVFETCQQVSLAIDQLYLWKAII